VRWGPNRRKEARASGSPRGVNDSGVSTEAGEKKRGSSGHRERPVVVARGRGGARGAVGVTRE
jgi:hypothetical protein